MYLCAVVGRVDSGKSTLVAVLTHGVDGRPLKDNGRGTARMAVFRHKHEVRTGRTSSISRTVLGYDEDGRVINYAGVRTATPAEISIGASKVRSSGCGRNRICVVGVGAV
jgi:GTPase